MVAKKGPPSAKGRADGLHRLASCSPKISGTLSLPQTKKPAATKVTIRPPLDPERYALATKADASADLPPEHRRPIPRSVRAARSELAQSLIELTRDVPIEPKATRRLRLALAVIDLTPELPASFVTAALYSAAADAPEDQRGEIEELRRSVFGTVNDARLARFRAMAESALAIAEERHAAAAAASGEARRG